MVPNYLTMIFGYPRIIRMVGRAAGELVLVLLAIALLAPQTFSQTGGTTTNNEVAWPHTFTLGLGGAANYNMQPTGTAGTGDAADPFGTYGYTSSVANWAPEFHVLAEIPLGADWMFAPRIAYNDQSLKWDAQNTPGGVASQPLTLTIQNLQADLLAKYSISELHVMGGVDLGTPLKAIAYSNGGSSGNLPSYEKFLASVKAGVGYDIPLNSPSSIWLTPEVFYSYPLTKYASNNGMDVYASTLSGGASLKFGLGGAPPPPPPTPIAATISAHGVMTDGSLSADLVSPQQMNHTRQSIPLLPYVFFDDNSAVISARYERSGATGFNAQTALAGKDALDANHDLLDVTGERLKADPNLTVTITGTNCNSGEERHNIMLSKQRAEAVASYLENTWGIAPSRITIDQRDLPELPTNPLTKAGREENRRVEIASNDADLTAPIKIENRQAVNVGATTVRYDMTVTPDPTVHTYTNWSVTLDKDGVQLAPPLTGTGAPPASTTEDVPNAANYIGQPVHYTLSVTDNEGQTAHAEGYTRIESKTVDNNNLEKYGMLSFDFDRSDINARARQMLSLISESINNGATGVGIDGYCDATGTPEYNQTLSEARANAAVTALRSMTSLPANVTVRGHGLRDPRFTNDLPEGRQLNRRVEFTIEKAAQ